MSTSETIEFNIAKCPCGKGHIVKEVTSQDNPWSGVDISHYVGCQECRTVWSVRGEHLQNIDDDRQRTEAMRAWIYADEAVLTFMKDEVEDYFGNPKFKNMAQEHREMQQLSLAPRDLRLYRQGRNSGKKYSELCRPAENPAWLLSLAQPVGKADELRKLLAANADAKATWHSKQVLTINFSQLEGFKR